MIGDLFLKILISFLIPFLLLYSVSCFFYIKEFGVLTLLNFSISVLISYILFYLRFGKINPFKVISFKKFISIFLFCFLCFIYYFLNILVK